MNRKLKKLERAFHIAGLGEEFDKILQTLKEIDESVWFGIYHYYFNTDCETEVGLGLTKESYCIQVAIQGDITKYVNRIDGPHLQETLNELSSPVEVLYFDENKRFLASYSGTKNANSEPRMKEVYKDLGIPSNKSVGILITNNLKEFHEILEYQKKREMDENKTKSELSNLINTTIIEVNFIPNTSPTFDTDKAFVDLAQLLQDIDDVYEVDVVEKNTICLASENSFQEIVNTIINVLEYSNRLDVSLNQNNIEMIVLKAISNPGINNQEEYLAKIKLDPMWRIPKLTCIKTENWVNSTEEDILDIAEKEKLVFGDR